MSDGTLHGNLVERVEKLEEQLLEDGGRDFWCDTFTEALGEMCCELGPYADRTTQNEVAHRAAGLADAALAEYRQRFGGEQ